MWSQIPPPSPPGLPEMTRHWYFGYFWMEQAFSLNPNPLCLNMYFILQLFITATKLRLAPHESKSPFGSVLGTENSSSMKHALAKSPERMVQCMCRRIRVSHQGHWRQNRLRVLEYPLVKNTFPDTSDLKSPAPPSHISKRLPSSTTLEIIPFKHGNVENEYLSSYPNHSTNQNFNDHEVHFLQV